MNSELKYREYGTDIFYDAEDGHILHMDNEIAGVIVEQKRMTKEELSHKYNIPSQKIKKKSIEKGALLDTLKNRKLVGIDTDRDKLIFSEDGGYYVIHYEGQYEKHEYTIEELMSYYKEHYLFNLRNVLYVDELDFEWVSIDDMEIRKEVLDISWFNYFDDGFVAESFSDRALLAKDIMENGTYWPLVLQREENTHVVYEGNHRVISAKLLQLSEEWSNQDLLAIVTDYSIPHIKDGTSPLYLLPMKMRARAPYIAKFYDIGYPSEDNQEIISQIMQDRNMTFVDDRHEIVEYDIYTYTELFLSTQIFPHWLRDLFYIYKEEGATIKGLDMINNKERFEEWMLCSKTL